MTKKLVLFIAACAMTSLWACTEDNPSVKCVEQNKRCNDNNVEICSGGAWITQVLCNAPESCNATSLTCEIAAACIENNERCNVNNVEICSDGAWKIKTQCPTSTICNANTLTCDADSCNEGETRCTSIGKLLACHNNSWNVSDCPTGQTCPSGKTACVTGVCNDGDIRCNDNKNGLLTCENDTWIETACAAPTAVCNDKQCVACTNGDKRCQDNAVLVCAGNAWTTEKACASQSCDATTHTCVNVNCQSGWKRCNGNKVEICNATNEYEADYPCASVCLEDSNTHTTQCVGCKEDKDCSNSISDRKVCHSDNTCVVCHAGSDKKCHPSNGNLLTCDSYGAWPTTGTACSAGLTCEAGKTECTPKANYCTGNEDCTDSLYPNCSKNVCVCTNNQGSCKIEGEKAKYAVCSAGDWSVYAQCPAATPACNTAKTQCVQCSDDIHCGDNSKCNTATNKCQSTLAESSITWCESHMFDKLNQVAYGRVLDPRNPKNSSTITAKLLCGNFGQKISEFKETLGSHNPACIDCYTEFEYKARPLVSSGSPYYCLWTFAISGEKPVACQTNGYIVKDFSFVPDTKSMHAFTPVWDHIIDFGNFKAASRYAIEETVVDGMITAEKAGAIIESGNGCIDQSTLVFSDHFDQFLIVTNAEKNAYIHTLAFDYKGWLNDDFKNNEKIEIYLDAQSSPFYVLKLSGKYETLQTLSIPIKQNVKTFRIQREFKSTNTAPRLLIDNVRWTTHN